jgi:hypothetical protein
MLPSFICLSCAYAAIPASTTIITNTVFFILVRFYCYSIAAVIDFTGSKVAGDGGAENGIYLLRVSKQVTGITQFGDGRRGKLEGNWRPVTDYWLIVTGYQ